MQKTGHSALFLAGQSRVGDSASTNFEFHGKTDCAANGKAGWPVFCALLDNCSGYVGRYRFLRLFIIGKRHEEKPVCYSAVGRRACQYIRVLDYCLRSESYPQGLLAYRV